MIFFSERKLAVRLRDDMVSAKERLVYLIIFNVLVSMIGTTTYGHYINVHDQLDIYSYLNDAATLLVAVIAPLYAYTINKRGDGADMVARYLCLSFPISIKAVLISFILGIAIFFVSKAEPFKDLYSSTSATGVLTCLAVIAIYGFIIRLYGQAFKIASGQTARETVNV